MSKTAPSHITLDEFWPYQATVLADQISRFTLSVVREEAGLNLSQWRVLAAVVDKPGRTAAQVTVVTPMDKTIVSRAVSSLIKASHIEKSPTKDKRRLSLTATESGLEIYRKIAVRLNRSMINTFKGGTPPEDFIKTLKEFSGKMDSIT